MKLFYIIAAFILSFSAISQTTLITNIEPICGTCTPNETTNQINEIELNFDELKLGPDSLIIELSDSSTILIENGQFIPKHGYTFRDEDDDPPGTPVFWLTPGLTNDDLSYLWKGSNSEYQVLLNVHMGILNGYITSNEKRYGIKKKLNGTYVLIDVRLEGFRPMDIIASSSVATPIPEFDNPNRNAYITNVKKMELRPQSHSGNQLFANESLDIMVLYDEDARVANCNLPCDPDDTDGIEGLIHTSVEHANSALSNSLVVDNISTIYIGKLNGFTFNDDPIGDRELFRINASVNSLRNQVGADVVSFVHGAPPSLFEHCGIAYVQTHPTCDVPLIPGCSDGTLFEDFAFNLVAQDCSIWNDTFTHELGHLMGANHVAIESPNPGFQLPSGWISDVSNNGYPEAFATRVTGSPSFASIMSIAATPVRELYFSNPNVVVDGIPTGETLNRYNAETLNSLIPGMKLYKNRPDLIFEDDFEN